MAQKIRFVNKSKTEFFPVLKKRVDEYFESNNMTRHGNGLMIFKIVFYLTAVFGALGLLLFAPLPVWAVYTCWVVIGFFSAFCGLGICHDAIHGSLFANAKLNRAFGFLFNVLGANDYMWDIMHNKVHHSFTNIEGHDEDLDAVPFLRMSPHKPLRPIHRYQHLFAMLFYGFATLSWVFVKDYKKMRQKAIGGMPTPKHPRKQWIRLFIGKAIYYTLFIVLPFIMIDVAWYHILLGFLLSHYVEGFTLAIIFMLAHIVEEVEYPLPNEKGQIENAWAVHQLYTSANFSVNNPVVSFFCGGLNFQVEHHLFPKVCHVHLPAISKIVRQTAKEYDLPYYADFSIFGALGSHLRLLKRFGREEAPTPAHPVAPAA